MVDPLALNRKHLNEVRIGVNYDKVDPAWQDETNLGFLICYEINLVFNDGGIYSVEPCEVSIPDRYPGLGLQINRIEKLSVKSLMDIPLLPMRVSEIILSDHSGEDVINQYVFVFNKTSKIIFRHVYPPMTMGVKIEVVDA